MTRYVLDHLPPIGPPGRAQLKLYRGGHMLYLDPQSRKAFSADAGGVLSGGGIILCRTSSFRDGAIARGPRNP